MFGDSGVGVGEQDAVEGRVVREEMRRDVFGAESFERVIVAARREGDVEGRRERVEGRCWCFRFLLLGKASLRMDHLSL